MLLVRVWHASDDRISSAFQCTLSEKAKGVDMIGVEGIDQLLQPS